MTDSTAPALSRWQTAAVLLLLACLALLPFGRSAELAILLCAIAGVVAGVRGQVDWQGEPERWSIRLFAAYWLPELASAFDAVNAARAWQEVALDLRYLPMLLFACVALKSLAAQRVARQGCAWIVAIWVADALLQAATGWSIGGPASADRLSGVFGADDLKLGGALALLSPFLLLPAFARGRWLGVLASAAVLVVVLLAGARAAWLSFALVLMVLVWQAFGGGRKALLALSTSLAIMIGMVLAAYQGSASFHARIERSAAALQGADGVDHALSGRLPIWQTAVAMFREQPINGVGVRGFRDAYAAHAEADDPWLGFAGEAGAFHAHQWLLEVASETGAIGLLCWILAGLVGMRLWREAAPTNRGAAAAVSLALLAMLFPFNTHYAFYSSAWGGLLFFLLALWLPMITFKTSTKSTHQERGSV